MSYVDLILTSRLLLDASARQEHNKLNWDKFLSFRRAVNLLGRAFFSATVHRGRQTVFRLPDGAPLPFRKADCLGSDFNLQ
jgi:hypothetical protein